MAERMRRAAGLAHLVDLPPIGGAEIFDRLLQRYPPG
jgi:hypothetical protein